MSAKIISLEKEYERRRGRKPESSSSTPRTGLIPASRWDYLKNCKSHSKGKRNFVLLDILESLYSSY